MSNIATLPQAAGALSAAENRMNALVPQSIGEALQLADVMAKASLIPEHLRSKPGDCLLIVMQAQRWGMDAVSVAQCTSVVRGKLCYEGKLVASVLYAMGAIDGRLRYEFDGSGDSRRIIVTGKPRGSATEQSVSGTVKDWATNNDAWKRITDDMLVYRGTRQWARRYSPEALLGIYTPDEIEEVPQVVHAATIVSTQAPGTSRAEKKPYPEADFEKNYPKWLDVIDSGKKSPGDIVATLESMFVLSEGQRGAILDIPAEIERIKAADESGAQA